MSYCYTYTEDEAERLHSYVDFVVCLGGDGVILHASCLFGASMPPLLAFHLGSMGFLTQHHFDDFKCAAAPAIPAADNGAVGSAGAC
jgi:NAD+ kinase